MGLPARFSLLQTQDTKSMMKVAILLSLLVVCVVAAPQKRVILGDVADEAAKILKCQGMVYEEACKQCCSDTKFLISGEQAGCQAVCNLLPDRADYDATTLIPYST